ncbi:hypothetical protein GALMADRAFT_238795 [Galerina marginata CBS 339.88]|uniref:DUF6699 domain-containing protein n=1 Tax=Galerina marginata (strain CBS 339.88) TaxID=685588 RepID=A0A067TT11_GALM3|nr:hypothetical protein GALMADRAFT_238795 [Galerina marginata CBS 339.88]
MTWETDPPIHANLTWPLIDYATRKRAPEPLIYFDAGFNPRNSKYPVKAKRGLHWSPLTREEETMFVSLGAFISNMVIINKRLEAWPIHIRMSHNIRIIDVFRAIYDVYAQPLTERELRDCGPEYIQRCERAFLQRCQDGPDFAHNEQRKGMLRIDLLRGRRVFKGLTPIPGQPHTFELLFDDI